MKASTSADVIPNESIVTTVKNPLKSHTEASTVLVRHTEPERTQVTIHHP